MGPEDQPPEDLEPENPWDWSKRRPGRSTTDVRTAALPPVGARSARLPPSSQPRIGAHAAATPTGKVPAWVIIGLVVALIPVGIGAGVALSWGSSGNRSSGGSLDLQVPSFAATASLAPGFVNDSASASRKAPLLCGGTRSSHLVAAVVARQPGSQASLSIEEFSFSSAAAAVSYAAHVVSIGTTTAPCSVKDPYPAEFQPGSLIPFNVGQAGLTAYGASGAERFVSGPLQFSYVWSNIIYLPIGHNVFTVRADTINGYANDSFLDVVVNNMVAAGEQVQLPGGRAIPTGYPVTGTLEHTMYSNGVSALVPSAAAGAPYFDCPAVVVDGVRYTVVFDGAMINAQSAGLVVPSSSGTGTVTIPWGGRVTMRVDSYAAAAKESPYYCEVSKNAAAHYVNVVSMRPAG